MRLDLRGLECPVPTMKAVEALRRLRSPEEVVVVVDDAVCAAEIPFQAGRLGYEPCTAETGKAEWTITLRPRSRRGA